MGLPPPPILIHINYQVSESYFTVNPQRSPTSAGVNHNRIYTYISAEAAAAAGSKTVKLRFWMLEKTKNKNKQLKM